MLKIKEYFNWYNFKPKNPFLVQFPNDQKFLWSRMLGFRIGSGFFGYINGNQVQEAPVESVKQ